MNYYRITILYYYIFYLASFGLNAEIVDFELKSIQAPTNVYESGVLTYFPIQDETENLNHYIFLETDVTTVELIDGAIQLIKNWLEQNSLDSMSEMMIDVTDNTAGKMYKIMQKDIEHYFYENNVDVSIVYKGYGFTLNFAIIQDARKFIETLPESIIVIDKMNFESLKRLTENPEILTTFHS